MKISQFLYDGWELDGGEVFHQASNFLSEFEEKNFEPAETLEEKRFAEMFENFRKNKNKKESEPVVVLKPVERIHQEQPYYRVVLDDKGNILSSERIPLEFKPSGVFVRFSLTSESVTVEYIATEKRSRVDLSYYDSVSLGFNKSLKCKIYLHWWVELKNGKWNVTTTYLAFPANARPSETKAERWSRINRLKW